MREAITTYAERRLILVASIASLAVCLPLSARAQGSGPPAGMEVLLWLFLAGAAVFVLVLSTVLYWAGQKLFFKDREASRLEKLVLFTISVLASCAAGIAVMIVFDLR